MVGPKRSVRAPQPKPPRPMVTKTIVIALEMPVRDQPVASDTTVVSDHHLDSSGTLKLSAGRKRHVLVKAV